MQNPLIVCLPPEWCPGGRTQANPFDNYPFIILSMPSSTPPMASLAQF